ncbi:MAG: helix-turn-helix transcriptional regulator [Lachnospiraceae bacterium]|nr:helix-turn-helix transcriptional regulator [Lachnospiraceae bacterium]
MEQKTIGKFITALRKANGMTQKDLAEQLNVSDKTVSRWERDEGTPDLAMIPVIAEIFGVTCDELLRGERKSPAERKLISEQELDSEEKEVTVKGEKQRQRLLKLTISQYQNRTYIAMGVSVVGMIVALICNLAFPKAVLGFLLGTVFFVASIVCQAIFMNRSFLSVEDAGLEEQELSRFRRCVIGLAQKSFGLTISFLGFTFPWISMDAYVGLNADSMLLYGALSMAAFLVVYAVILYFVNASLLKKEVYCLSEKEAVIYRHNHKLKARCAAGFLIVIAITFLIHQAMTTIWGPFSIMERTTFNDYESFVTFMEQDIPAEPYEHFSGGTTAVEHPIPQEVPGTAVYYDQYGNEITEEEARHRTLEDANGNVVCEYQDRNESVISMQYSPKDGTVLPITVSTQEDLNEARQLASVRHVIFAVVYMAEALAALLVYFKLRKR